MNRRGFLGSILAAAAAPAIVRADSLMRVMPLETELLAVGEPVMLSVELSIEEFYQRHMRPALDAFTGMANGILYVNGHPFAAPPERLLRNLHK